MALIWVPGGLLVLLAFTISSTGGLIVKGHCPDVESQANFEMDQYAGIWYHQEELSNLFEDGTPCTNDDYRIHDDGTISLDVGDLNKVRNGKIIVPDPSKPAELLYYHSEPDLHHTLPLAYFVADTDYKTYTVEFSCKNLDDHQSLQYSWIMTREREEDPVKISDVKAILQLKGVDINLYHQVDQSKCDSSELKTLRQ